MERRRGKLSDQIRAAVDASGKSRYRIAKELGIAESTISRFMSGQGGLSMDNLDALVGLLGLDLAARRQATTKAKKSQEKNG
jgi:transcriptional regulator with XRE-family HTH domain